MSTIEKFLESPSSTFEDVTDIVLARGGANETGGSEVQDVEVVIDEAADLDSGRTAELLEKVVGVVDEVGEAVGESVVDSAAVVADPAEPVKEDEASLGAVASAAVESTADDVDNEPEPPRRRRRR